MTYLLDTNTCIRYLNDAQSRVASRLAALPRTEIVLCDVVRFELYYGAYRSTRRERNLQLLATFFNGFTSLPSDGRAADIGGRIRTDLASQGTPIGPNDLLIAAIALANDLTLVTHNIREFGRVEGLTLEDWEADT